MWYPEKHEAERAEKLILTGKLSPQEKKSMSAIIRAYKTQKNRDWLDRAVLMSLEEKYKGQLAEL
ncbi:hypothetical protein DPW03_09070 [Aggregatibacter aphrophilus]|jgi:hypothetical protein|uniref:hypothetical protein n=1 Tax=Aggregatibacter kilianii TaxID=2025884 RepID=UPI000D64E240|nr:hypothetical protein [Aggregatibacter kilianii]RDE94860.1 hypothetical protein DPW03_09070 [Aggregatibacter aphrophilus]RDF02147.1 hypothetical protein DPV99_05340 [Aggregatibacter aphrophilus]DAW69258.1 MAG TPA: hypothetical protein [Caudoviricetes sp.]